MRSMGNTLGLLALLLVLASCGGGAGTPDIGPGPETLPPEPAPGIGEPGARNPVPDVDGNGQPAVPDTTAAARPLPSVPLAEGRDSADFSDGTNVVLGGVALDYSLCEVRGDAMIINPDGMAGDSQEQLPAWALYRISGLDDTGLLSLNGEVIPDGFGRSYKVAVADVASLEWVWLGPASFPEYEFDLTGEHQYISDEGNLHFLIVCDGDNSAVHQRSTIALDAGGNTAPTPVLLFDLYGYVHGYLALDPIVVPGNTGSGDGGPSAGQYGPLVRLLDPETEDIANEEYGGGDASPEALSGVAIQLISSDGAVVRHALTDANGYFELEGVSPGEYLVVAQLDGWLFQPAGHRVSLPASHDGLERARRLDFLGLPTGAN